jgi:putative membrane protein
VYFEGKFADPGLNFFLGRNVYLDEGQCMKNSPVVLKTAAFGRAFLFAGAICIVPHFAWSQTTPSPADGQTKGAAINDSINGTTPLPNPADQLGHMGGVNAGQQASIDKMFVKKAMQGGLAEVQMGELTLKNSSNDQVKQFARKMIDDHTKLNEELRPIAQQLGVDIPTDISKKDKSMIGKMQGLSGPAYDQAYLKEMAKEHTQDQKEFRMEVSNSQNVGVKNAALDGGKTISEHLQMVTQLAKDQNVDLAKK